MSIPLELPPNVEASLRDRAAARGLNPADYLRALVERDAEQNPDADPGAQRPRIEHGQDGGDE